MIKRLEDFKTYNKAMKIGEKIWTIVAEWNCYEKDTIGRQLVRAVDSIAANLSEGLGRQHYKEIKNCSYRSWGSLFEAKTWLAKAKNRNMISANIFEQLTDELDEIGRMINGYIRSIGKKSHEVNGPEEEYLDPNLTPIPNAPPKP